MEIKKASVVGLGKLGLPLAAVLASKGCPVFGYDPNPKKVIEKGLDFYLEKNKDKFQTLKTCKEAVLNSDITFIVVPTPSKEDGDFSTEYAFSAAQEIAQALKEKNSFHMVVLVSTVTPGSCERDILPILKTCGKDFGFCYNPEFIALGSVIYDILNPDFILIGELNSLSGEILENFYKNICENKPPVKRMSIVNAEISKISLNAFVTTKISFANMLSAFCEKVEGGDIDKVTDAIGCDKRIGHKYLKGALGYAGPCFPRDNKALLAAAKKYDVPFYLSEATEKINQEQPERLLKLILSFLPKGGRVGILGLAYKPETNVISESQSFKLINALKEKGIDFFAFDPVVKEESNVFSAEECIKKSDLICLLTPWKEFENLNPAWFENKYLLDCWRILDKNKFKKGTYIPLGVNKI